ncbi:MAG: hypothetical protein NC082_08265 [Clostridiales bacterium]|nr:hypothetical protein [Clostridiales bacterium]
MITTNVRFNNIIGSANSLESVESFIRGIALKKECNDPIANEFFRIMAKSFWRITSNSILQSRLVEESIVYSFGIVMDSIDPDLGFKKALDTGLSNYIEQEPLLRKEDKSKTDLVRLTVVRVAYYVVFLKIAFDEELVPQDRTSSIFEHFESIFKKYIPREKVELDTQLSTEDFLQKIKFVYKQAYRGLPSVYVPANLFLSVSLVDFSDFDSKEWRYYANCANLDKALCILSSSRMNIERKRLFEYFNKCVPEIYDNYTISQMRRYVGMQQAYCDLNEKYVKLQQEVELLLSKKSGDSSDELLSMIRELRQENEALKMELERKTTVEMPDPLSFYIEDEQLLRKTIDYAESPQCTSKINVYNGIYKKLLDSGISRELLRSAEFIRALFPHLKHLKGVNYQEIRPKDILNFQQTFRKKDSMQM